MTRGYEGAAPPPPAQTCSLPTPAVDTSKPKTVVGDGTAASCTETALDAAVAAGGIVTFYCGTAPVTITVTSEVPVTQDTTIDGGNLVTLSGGKKTRIMHIKSAWNVATPLLTVQNLAFTDGYTTDVLNTTSTKEGGAAIFEDGGSLTVIDCTFTDNRVRDHRRGCTPAEPSTGKASERSSWRGAPSPATSARTEALSARRTKT